MAILSRGKLVISGYGLLYLHQLSWYGVNEDSKTKLGYSLPWALTSYVKLRVAHAPGMPGTFSPPPRFSHPDTHHGTCVIANQRFSLKSAAFSAHAQPAILRIWQEVHPSVNIPPNTLILVGETAHLRMARLRSSHM